MTNARLEVVRSLVDLDVDIRGISGTPRIESTEGESDRGSRQIGDEERSQLLAKAKDLVGSPESTRPSREPAALRWKRYLVLACCVAGAVFNALAALPFLRLQFGEVPRPGTAPRYMGEVTIAGELKRTRTAWRPPQYFITTTNETVEFRCGFWPGYATCPLPYRSREGEVFEIGIDPFWGVDYIKYPAVRGYTDIWSGYQMDQFRNKQARGRLYNLFLSIALGLGAMFVLSRLLGSPALR